MNPERWNRVDELLQSALDLPATDRDAYLRQACGGDQRLEGDVRSLLAAHDRAGGFLSTPAVDLAAHELAVPSADDPLIGQTFSHYRIVEKLGGGGMGVVYKAEDTRLRRLVALKFVSDELSRHPEAMSRFAREAQTASALNHPNICTIHDIGEQDGRSFIVMEYLDGTTLMDRLAAGPLSLSTVVDVGIQIADALEAAHAAGIIHRDIKPANIFIGARDRVKVLDFGLAKTQVAPAERGDLTTIARTQQGVVMGTVAYMAPEQAAGELVDHRADIWSFGAVLHEMATGARPAPGVSVRLEKAGGLERIIRKCLDPDRALRYQHAAEVRTDLESLRTGSHVATAPQPGRGGHRALWLSLAAAAVIAAAAAGVFYGRRPAPLTNQDTIVLADFDNRTGDAVFDDTLRQGLSVELRQSPFLRLISDQQVQTQLALMGEAKDALLTPERAQQVCVRTGGALMLEGSIAGLGSQYVLGLRARDCNTGETVDEQQAQVARREDILNALSQVARQLRTRVGESQETIDRHSMPLAQATTASLEALKAYSLGSKMNLSSGSTAGTRYFQRAVEIDPMFAMAHASLGIAYSAAGESDLSAQSTVRAWQLRDRVSDRERFYIDFMYDRQVTGNLEKAYQTLELWLRTYPIGEDSLNPRALLGGISSQGTGRFERVLEVTEATIAEEPAIVFGYTNRAGSLIFLDRFGDAERTLELATERGVDDGGNLLLHRYQVAVATADQQKIAQAVALSRNKPAESAVTHLESLAAARSGRLVDARQVSGRAVDVASQRGDRAASASFRAARAVWEALYGNAADARANANVALNASRGRDVTYAAALALALAGDSTRSQSLADDLERRFPQDTFVTFTYVPVLRSITALKSGSPAEALEHLQATLPYELAANGLNFNRYLGGLHSAYVRGLALLALRRHSEAAAEFQKILDHRGLVGPDPIGAAARLQLARTLVLAGDTVKAKSTYRDLLALWTNADPDLPLLKEARAEAARLP